MVYLCKTYVDYNEVNVLLNENKVKMMTKMAIYEKNEGRRMLRTARYFKGDYVAFGILKTLITTTLAFAIVAIMYVLCNAEGLVENINSMDYLAFGKKVAIYYIIMLVIFAITAGFVYSFQYENSRKGLKKYFSRLNKLERFYNGQKKKKIIVEEVMAVLLEFKEKFRRFYNKYDTYLVPALKFIVALVSFIMLNASIGYMEKLNNPVIAILISVICAFLPVGFTIVMLSLFMVAHLYAISVEFALIALCVVLLMYLLYFRFASKSGYLLILTVFMCWIKMPFVLPVAVGLCSSVISVVPVSFGVIIYYIINTASVYETAVTNKSLTESMLQVSYLIESLVKNKQLFLVMAALAVTIIIVYIVRRLKIDYAWGYAIAIGSVAQFVVVVLGEILLKTGLNIILIVISVILGALAGYICNILFFAVDFRRTEYVQYEDDEYYYYVKAVPKINVAGEDVRVKQINARKTKKPQI